MENGKRRIPIMQLFFFKTSNSQFSIAQLAIDLYLLMQVDDALIDKLSELSMLKFSAEEKREIKKRSSKK